MNAVVVRFYVHHTHKHFNVMLFDWILAQAKSMSIHGGSAFCATAGFGRHGVIHEQRFVELAADLPIMVEFIVSEEQADRLIELIWKENIQTFCTRTPTEVISIDDADPGGRDDAASPTP